MKIAVVGTGYVGLVAGTGFAENGHNVVCVDKSSSRIAALTDGKIPIHEPGLEELVMHNLEEERITFSTDLPKAVSDSLLVFLCVGTPEGPDGATDLSQVYAAAEEIGDALTGYRIIVNKSSCPVGTVEKLREIIGARTSHPFDVVANPEFLKEGNAIDDFMRPDRVVVGCTDVRVLEIMKELYGPFLRTGKPFIAMDVRSAELSKYGVNAMLAARISLVNELASLAEAYGADINEIRQAMMADSRIGSSYLFPGLGFGGSCLPKDVVALSKMAEEMRVDMPLVAGASKTNARQRQQFIERILDHFGGDVAGKTIAIWGATFKPRTDDVRSAPALDIINALLDKGAKISVYDPAAEEHLTAIYGNRVTLASKPYTAVEGADALVIATEWREFHNPDFERIAGLMKSKIIFDGRNLYTPKTIAAHGFQYISVGRPAV